MCRGFGIQRCHSSGVPVSVARHPPDQPRSLSERSCISQSVFLCLVLLEYPTSHSWHENTSFLSIIFSQRWYLASSGIEEFLKSKEVRVSAVGDSLSALAVSCSTNATGKTCKRSSPFQNSFLCGDVSDSLCDASIAHNCCRVHFRPHLEFIMM